MRKIEIKKYQFGDEKFETIETITQLQMENMKNWDLLINPDLTWSGFCNGKVAVIGGLIPENDNRALVWIQVNKECQKNKTAIMRILTISMRILESYGYKLYAYIRANFDEGYKLLEYFGFEKLSIVRSGYDNYYLCERL